MANNRLLIRCRGCKQFMSWAKFYPSDVDCGWYTNVHSNDFNDFFEKHSKCNEMDNDGSFWDLMDENDERVELVDFPKRELTLKGDK